MTGVARNPVARGREVATVIITAIAIMLFVAIGSTVLGTALRGALGGHGAVDHSLLVALLLNVALILFGWRRHRDLVAEVQASAAGEARASRLAAHDPLTGLLNRRGLGEHGAEMLDLARRRDKAFALMMIDLDHFKTVNDMHGHAVGDALLRLVAAEIADTIPRGGLAARFGGDEFACAFPVRPESRAGIGQIADRLIARMGRGYEADGVLVHVSASIGIAVSDADHTSFEAMIRAADMAMYEAKSSGRDRFAWFDPEMERRVRTRDAVELGLRSAIPNGEIVPFFDRQIDLATRSLVGFEVLARWRHPKHGLIAPDGFIPVAERTGLIGDLSLATIRQAFTAARDWDATLSLAVNLSPSQFKDPRLAQKIIKLLTETGFPPGRLEVEITERALLDNVEHARAIAGSLKDQGIALVLDDFGTGYSSLAHLRALPFDRIKIDHAFVASVGGSDDSAAIVRAVAALGESLNLPITAEGIENEMVEARLRALGCSRGQGYLYGQPMPLGEVRQMLAEPAAITSRRQVG